MSATTKGAGERRGVDGRATFTCFAFGFGLAVLALLERMGVAAPVIRALLLFGVLGGIVAIAVLQRTMRISRFYAGGRAMTAGYAGLALSGLIAGLAVPLLSAPAALLPRPALGAGLLLGGVCAGLLTGPLLRKTGAFSIPDLLATRFPSLALRLAVVGLVAVIAGLLGLAAFESAVRPMLAAVGLGRPLGAAVTAGLLMLVIVPGGLGGAVWAAAAAVFVLFVALGLPFFLPAAGVAPAPLADALAHLSAAGQGLAQWGAVSQRIAGLDPLLGAALTIGVGVLVPLVGPAIACESTAQAQSAGRRALVLGLLLIALAAGLVGSPVRGGGLVPPTLALAAQAAVALALAAAAVQAFAAMLGHDVVHRVRDATALTSRRLAITRAFAIGALLVAAIRVGAAPLDPVPFIGIAIWLSAAAVAPLLALALWSRAGSLDAAVALITACGAALAALLAGPPDLSAARFALSAVVACGMGLLAGLISSMLRRDRAPAGADFVRSVLRETGEFPQLDRGA